MNKRKLSKKNPFVIGKTVFDFHCDYGVWPKGKDGSVCYCTGKIEARFIAQALTDWWASNKGQKWLKKNVLHGQYLKESKMTILKERIDRAMNAIRCPKCSGYAERVDLTKEEIKKQSCGRSYECCGRAFVCRVCGERIVCDAESPEMD